MHEVVQSNECEGNWFVCALCDGRDDEEELDMSGCTKHGVPNCETCMVEVIAQMGEQAREENKLYKQLVEQQGIRITRVEGERDEARRQVAELTAALAGRDEEKDSTLVGRLKDVCEVIDHPPHYAHIGGLEAIDLCERLSFCLGNAIKYLWRAGKKGNTLEDLKKAQWYLRRWGQDGTRYPWIKRDAEELLLEGKHTRDLARRVRDKSEGFDNLVIGQLLDELTAPDYPYQAKNVGDVISVVEAAIKKLEAE